MSQSIDSTRPPRTATPGSLCRSYDAARRPAGSAKVAARFHGAPTNRSQRATIERDCPELLARCRADRADVAVFVAN